MNKNLWSLNENLMYYVAREFIKIKDFENAKNVLEIVSKCGSVDATIDLGATLERLKDYKGALRCYQVGAIKNSSTAIYNLGLMYEMGRGVEVDLYQALEHYTRLYEDKKWSDSAYLRSHYCYIDLGDEIQAVELLFKAVENSDNLKCMVQLGYCYECGIGVEVNKQKAFDYYIFAAANGDRVGCYNVGQFYYNKENKQYNLELALKYYIESAKQNYGDAFYMLAKIFIYEKLEIANPAIVEFLLKKGIENDSFESLFMYAKELYRGTYIKKDIVKANEIFKIAYEKVEKEFKEDVLKEILEINPEFNF